MQMAAGLVLESHYETDHNGCSGLMEPDTFMRDNIVNHRGVIYDAKAQLQAVSERV